MRTLRTIAGILFGGGVLTWLGLGIWPKPFARPAPGTAEPETMPLPPGLPAPVERFYRRIYGTRAPVVRSAVITGRATLRLGPVAVPARFRFIHEAGKAYSHQIDVAFYGHTIVTVHERYAAGKSRLDLPFGVVENEPKVDQGANLALWAESVWLPAIFLTDARVRWEPVGAETALLVVPFGAGEERFTARFDPATGLLRSLEAMRYRGAKSVSRTPWLCAFEDWRRIGGATLPATGSLTWSDARRPWAVFRAEDVVYNTDALPAPW